MQFSVSATNYYLGASKVTALTNGVCHSLSLSRYHSLTYLIFYFVLLTCFDSFKNMYVLTHIHKYTLRNCICVKPTIQKYFL